MEKRPVLTSTGEFSQIVLNIRTPQVEPTISTRFDFLTVLKKVSRKQEEPPAEPGEEKPKE